MLLLFVDLHSVEASSIVSDRVIRETERVGRGGLGVISN